MVGVVGVLVVSLGSRPLTFGVLVAVVGPLVGSPRVAGVEVTELAVFAGVLAVALAGVLATPAIGGPRLRLAIRLASVLGGRVVAPVLVAVLIHGPFPNGPILGSRPGSRRCSLLVCCLALWLLPGPDSRSRKH